MLNVFHTWLSARTRKGADPVKVRLLTNYCFYAVVFGILYSGFYLYIDFEKGFYIICLTIILIALTPFLFLVTSNNILVANFFLLLAWSLVFAIGLLTGGLYSNITPWLAFVILTSVLLTNINNSFLWLIIIIITILGFYLSLEEPFTIKVAYDSNYASFYYCIGYIGLCILVFVTSYLFHRERTNYVEQLETQSFVLQKKNSELEEAHRSLEVKNVELMEANDEILIQAEKIKDINDNLEYLVKKRTQELEKRNQQLEEYAHLNAHQLRAPICTTLGLYNLLENPEIRNEEIPIILTKLKDTIKDLNRVTKEVTKVIND